MYKIVGADQKEYGPVSEAVLRQWIVEGRANAQTIARLGEGPWKPLSTFPEFASLFGVAAGVSQAAPPSLLPATSATSSPPALNGMAVAGLACSIMGVTCGLACCGPLFSTLGLIFSAVALSQFNENPLKYSGRAVAVAGIVLGVIGYLVFGLLLSKGVLRRTIRRLPRLI